MKKGVLVIGANGALGTDLLRVLEHPVAAVHADFDIRDKDTAHAFIKAADVHAVVNTAAFHKVPLCETQTDAAFHANVLGPKNLAEICADLGLHFCHISTDYVFDGTKGAPYTEMDPTHPLSMYAITKLAGEHAALAYGDHVSIVRSSGLYGKVPTRAKGGNFINAMMKFGRERDEVTVVNDEVVSPTWTFDLARGIDALLRAECRGVYHVTQAGETTWFDFAQVIFEHADLPARLIPVSAAAFQSVVQRPAYSILSNEKFTRDTGFQMMHWKDALTAHLDELDKD